MGSEAWLATPHGAKMELSVGKLRAECKNHLKLYMCVFYTHRHIYIYIYIYIYTHTYTYIHTYTYTIYVYSVYVSTHLSVEKV